MTSAHDTKKATDGGAGPVPEDNRPGHRPGADRDKPYDKFAALAARAEGDSGADTDQDDVTSGASGRRPWVRGALVLVAVAVVSSWVLRRVLHRLNASRTDHLMRAVRGTMVDTVDHVKDTVDHVKGTVDHLKEAVVHAKDRLPG
jgi:hypothetical protein